MADHHTVTGGPGWTITAWRCPCHPGHRWYQRNSQPHCWVMITPSGALADHGIPTKAQVEEAHGPLVPIEVDNTEALLADHTRLRTELKTSYTTLHHIHDVIADLDRLATTGSGTTEYRDGIAYAVERISDVTGDYPASDGLAPAPGLAYIDMWTQLGAYVTARMVDPTGDDALDIYRHMQRLEQQRRAPLREWLDQQTRAANGKGENPDA
jgi:hypothetical protein